MLLSRVLRRTVSVAVCALMAQSPSAQAAQAAQTAKVPATQASTAQPLAFDVTEGLNLNSFLRQGNTAAHLLLRSGHDPRLLVAFPAGNSGVGLWFAHTDQPISWQILRPAEPYSETDAKGRPLYGLTVEAGATGGALTVRQAVLSSVRVLRDYQALGTTPPGVSVGAQTDGQRISWTRDRLDGAAGYRLVVEVLAGALQGERITADSEGRIRLRITALTGDTPLTPIPAAQLFEPGMALDPTAAQALTFLSFREKLLAGSWRFDTYFGRDTLMSVRLLMPVLRPAAVQAGLGAVLTRLSLTGEVAHEEDIGESAILDHRRAGEAASDAPVFNYQMIDGTFMLAPVITAWLLDDARGRSGAASFLADSDHRNDGAPRAFGVDLVTNLRLVLKSAAAFAAAPRPENLIGLKPGFTTGQWRDSGEGLGRGRYPYDVNAVFVPAALVAANRLYLSGLLNPYLDHEDPALFARAASMAGIWQAKAAPLFEVQISHARAVSQVSAYGTAVDVPTAEAEAAIDKQSVRFHAVALNADASAVPVMNSDEGFELLFGHPSAPALDQTVTALMRPFPAGLLTPVGMVVSNPVFAAPEVQSRFSRNAYHGTVIWSWQQAVFAAGLARQLQRHDLPPATRHRVQQAQGQLWRAIDAGSALRNSELWSWNYQDGHYVVVPFGVSQGDVDESNAAQLWSTVYLAIPDPTAGAR